MKHLKNVWVRAALGAALGFGLVSIFAPTANVSVECVGVGVGVGYSCTIAHVDGNADANVCWRLNITCMNGTLATANACQEVAVGGRTVRIIPLSQIKNAHVCDTLISVTVTDLKATTL